MKQVQIDGTFDGGYVIVELSGADAPISVSSDSDLRDYLRERGLSDSEIAQTIKDLRITRQSTRTVYR